MHPPCVNMVAGGSQDDLLDGLPSSDAFAELVRMALEKDPSLAPVHSSGAAARAASGVAGPSPDAAAGTDPLQRTCAFRRQGQTGPWTAKRCASTWVTWHEAFKLVVQHVTLNHKTFSSNAPELP